MLTEVKIKAAKGKEKVYRLSDKEGLYLEVHPNGRKYWRYKYRFDRKEKRLAIGVYPDITLKKARSAHAKAREQLENGSDPSLVKKLSANAGKAISPNSFELVAREWHSKQSNTWSEGYTAKVLRAMERDLFPIIGSSDVGALQPVDILQALRRIESRGAHEIAHRTKWIAGQVFRYAVATGRAQRDPTQDLRGALTPVKVKHYSALTEPKDVGELLVAIDNYKGLPIVSAALKLSPLLFVRPGELRHMEWTELDFEAKEWRIPGGKMKLGEDHIVPLCTQALAIIQDLKPFTDYSKYVFPSARGKDRPLSENGVRVALRTMGYGNEQMTAHGFRAIARTLLDEQLGVRVDLIEHQLAHQVKDPLGRAYNRTKHLDARRDMMQQWADYLDALREQAKGGNVVAGQFRQKK